MKHTANTKLNKVEFNNHIDWETYPTADFCCDNCNQIVSLSFSNWKKHQFSEYSNLEETDKLKFDQVASSLLPDSVNSFLDFYCPTCKKPVRIYYYAWAGGKHGEHGYSIKFVID